MKQTRLWKSLTCLLLTFLTAALTIQPSYANSSELQEVAELRETVEDPDYPAEVPLIDESGDTLILYQQGQPAKEISEADLPEAWIAAQKSNDSILRASNNYSYEYKYVIWKDKNGSSSRVAAIFSKVNKKMNTTFPLAGMPKTIRKNEVYYLQPGKNPVQVTSIGTNFFTLKSLPGHLEGANKYITFTIKYEKSSYVLVAKATGPKTVWQKNPINNQANKLFAYVTWSNFACRIRETGLGQPCR